MIEVLFHIILVLLAAGGIAWLVNNFWPAESKYKTAALGVFALLVLLIILSMLWPLVAPLLHLGPEPRSLR